MKRALTSVILLLSFALVGCDTSEPAEDEMAAIGMVPPSATIPVGDTRDFSIVGLTTSGDTVRDVDFDLRWWSTDTTVFTVNERGLAVAQGPGSAYCVAEVTSASKTALRFVGRDSAFITVLF